VAHPPHPSNQLLHLPLARLDAGDVTDLVIVPGSEIRGTWRSDRTGFRVVYPTAEVTPVLQRAERAGTPVTFDRAPVASGFWRQVALLVLVLGSLIYFMRRQLTAGETARLGPTAPSNSGFGDVAGHEATVAKLRELVEFLRTTLRHSAPWVRGRPRGVLMFGPPGTGKTLMAPRRRRRGRGSLLRDQRKRSDGTK